MRMVFSAAEKAGWLGEGQKRLDFMGFGLVQGQDGPAAFQNGKREKATIAISGNQTDIVGAGGAQFDFRNVSHLQPLGRGGQVQDQMDLTPRQRAKKNVKGPKRRTERG